MVFALSWVKTTDDGTQPECSHKTSALDLEIPEPRTSHKMTQTSHLISRWSHSGPKRILTLDGGGVRGMIAIQFLREIEKQVCTTDDCKVLADYFDLIGGTSTGSIIASLLALGKSVEEIDGMYRSLTKVVFKKRWLGTLMGGNISARFSKSAFKIVCKELIGDLVLGSEKIQTGLMIVTRRTDTGSPWVIHNNPDGKYFACDDDSFVPNSECRLGQIIMASCSAPTFFTPERIEIGRMPDGRSETGVFIDGGCTPYNNPALLAYRLVTVEGYKYRWPTGVDNLEIVSVGTGRITNRFSQSQFKPAALFGIQALRGLLDDCAREVEIMMQLLSDSPTSGIIDGEIGDLAGEYISHQPMFRYLRYNVDLDSQALTDLLGMEVTDVEAKQLESIERVELVSRYADIGRAAAEKCISPTHFK